jgi:hypothetical protein
MIPTGEIVFIRAACRHAGNESPAVIVRGLPRDHPNPAHPDHKGAEAFPVANSIQAGWWRVTGRRGFRYTFEYANWPDIKTAAFVRFPKQDPTNSPIVG